MVPDLCGAICGGLLSATGPYTSNDVQPGLIRCLSNPCIPSPEQQILLGLFVHRVLFELSLQLHPAPHRPNGGLQLQREPEVSYEWENHLGAILP